MQRGQELAHGIIFGLYSCFFVGLWVFISFFGGSGSRIYVHGGASSPLPVKEKKRRDLGGGGRLALVGAVLEESTHLHEILENLALFGGFFWNKMGISRLR